MLLLYRISILCSDKVMYLWIPVNVYSILFFKKVPLFCGVYGTIVANKGQDDGKK